MSIELTITILQLLKGKMLWLISLCSCSMYIEGYNVISGCEKWHGIEPRHMETYDYTYISFIINFFVFSHLHLQYLYIII